MENRTQQKNNLDKLLEKIEKGEFKNQAKFHFILRTVAIVAVVVAVLCISIFILNFILFSIRINSDESLLGFGTRGILAFLYLFPWILLIVDLGLVIFLQWILRSFRFGYKTPVLYLILGILFVAVLLGLILDKATDVNDRMLRRADQNLLPQPFGSVYGHAHRMMSLGNGICKCKVVSINGNILTVEDTRNGTSTIFVFSLPLNDPLATTTSLSVGDLVFVAGEIKDDRIEAFGLRKIESGMMQ